MTVPAAPQGLTHAAQSAAAKRHRLCAVTRVEKPVEDLIRFVLGPTATMAPDLANRLGGRGVWVTATRAAVTLASTRNVFAKSLKTQVKPTPDLADQVEHQLRERLRQALSFASKAGLVTTGFVKVEAALETGRTAVLVQAHDASGEGTDRLFRKFSAISAAVGKRAHLSRHFSGDELSMALGRTNVVHAALAGGGQTSAFLRESLRLERFRLNDETASTDTVTAPTSDAASVATSRLNTDKV